MVVRVVAKHSDCIGGGVYELRSTPPDATWRPHLTCTTIYHSFVQYGTYRITAIQRGPPQSLGYPLHLVCFRQASCVETDVNSFMECGNPDGKPGELNHSAREA